AVMGLDVVGVRELAGHPVAGGIAAADLVEPLQREIHVALAARREDEVGAVRAHDLLALVAHSRGHDDRAPIALHRGDERAGDAGVAGGALEHAHARLEIAARFRALEHVEIDPVLEAAARTVPLELEVDRRYHVGRHAAELDEGRAPDGLADGMERATVGIPEDRHGSRIVLASVAAVQSSGMKSRQVELADEDLDHASTDPDVRRTATRSIEANVDVARPPHLHALLAQD